MAWFFSSAGGLVFFQHWPTFFLTFAPVLGVLISDAEKDYYLVSLGADYNIDICIQRCITELFQGRKFDIWFKAKLNCTFEHRFFYANPQSKEAEYCYQQNITCNAGNYPLQIFDDTLCNGEYKRAFVSNQITNRELLRHALGQLKNKNHKIYICDYSHLGFPVFRIFIPGMSEISNLASRILENKQGIDDFLAVFYASDSLTKENVKQFTNAALELEKLPFFKVSNLCTAISGIPIINDRYGIGIDNINVLIALMNFYVSNYDIAYKHYQYYVKEKKEKYLSSLNSSEKGLLIAFKYFQDGYTWKELEPILISFGCNHIKEILTNINYAFLDLPHCPDCGNCHVLTCYHDKIRDIINNIHRGKQKELYNLKQIFIPLLSME